MLAKRAGEVFWLHSNSYQVAGAGSIPVASSVLLGGNALF